MGRPSTTALMVQDQPHERVVSLFRNGSNQAVRIPREFEFSGSEVVLRKEGHRLVLEPISTPALIQVLDWIVSEELNEPGFIIPEDPPPEEVSL